MKLPPLIYNSIGKFLLFAALEAVCLLLIVRNSTVQSSRVMEGVRTVQSFFWEKSAAVKKYTALGSTNRDLIAENARLLEQNAKLRDFIIRTQGEDRLAEISDQMRGNIGDSALTNFSFTLAKVVKNTLNTTHNYLILDKGENDGITEDLGVITPSGVVGIIRGTGPRFSYVMSLLNLKQSISAKLGRGSSLGTLKWEGGSICKAYLTEVALNTPVEKGDTVFTSGNSSFFPSDIPIGKALSFTIEDGMYKRVEVELLQDFSNLDYVIVIKNGDKREIDSLSAINAAYMEKK
ncbi:MAG: rod shape-determining protein MreC [Bacteroidales bacterium]|nr:rod shape-determining protein MreC [Bacteroidales bacterium]